MHYIIQCVGLLMLMMIFFVYLISLDEAASPSRVLPTPMQLKRSAPVQNKEGHNIVQTTNIFNLKKRILQILSVALYRCSTSEESVKVKFGSI